MTQKMYKFTIACLLIVVTGHVTAIDYQGRLSIVEKGKKVAGNEYADAIVFYIPEGQEKASADVMPPQEMRMENKSFSPRVLAVTAGTEVAFPNFDPILHNAFSTSSNNKFDLGFYSGGETKQHVFNKPGLVRVYCNVHHDMVAYVLVLNTPHSAAVAADGSFTLSNLPEGKGKLHVWHPRAKVLKKQLDLNQASSEVASYEVSLTKRRIPKHLNKKGKSYRRSRDSRY